MQEARNCGGKYPHSRFRLQLLNRTIINECPNTYFPEFIFLLYSQYARYKVMKILGISADPENISLLELDAYHLIEVETEKAREYKHNKEMKKKR